MATRRKRPAKLAKKPAKKVAKKPTKPAKKPAKKVAKKPTKPAKKPAKKVANKPAKSANKPAKSAKKAAKKPAKKATKKSATFTRKRPKAPEGFVSLDREIEELDKEAAKAREKARRLRKKRKEEKQKQLSDTAVDYDAELIRAQLQNLVQDLEEGNYRIRRSSLQYVSGELTTWIDPDNSEADLLRLAQDGNWSSVYEYWFTCGIAVDWSKAESEVKTKYVLKASGLTNIWTYPVKSQFAELSMATLVNQMAPGIEEAGGRIVGFMARYVSTEYQPERPA